MMIAYRARDRAVFLYGFAKNEQDNIDDDALISLKALAADWLAADTTRMDLALDEDEIREIFHGGEKKITGSRKPFLKRPRACTASES